MPPRSTSMDSTTSTSELSVEHLLAETAKHIPRSKRRLLESKRDELATLSVDELSKRIRMLFGAELLSTVVDALAGGEETQDERAPSNLDAGAKVLIHALLCQSSGPCSRPDCTPKVAKMKEVLKRMETHVAGCSVANLPGGKRDCSTCQKWVQLQKLRDRFTRQLIQAAPARRGAKTAKATQGSAPPPLTKHAVSFCMAEAADDENINLALLPQLIDGELDVQRRRREAKGGGSSRRGGDEAAAASGAAEAAAAGGFDMCGTFGCTLPDKHSGLHNIPEDHGKRARRPQLSRVASGRRFSAVEAAPAEEAEEEAADAERPKKASRKGKGKKGAGGAEDEVRPRDDDPGTMPPGRSPCLARAPARHKHTAINPVSRCTRPRSIGTCTRPRCILPRVTARPSPMPRPPPTSLTAER